jgi:BON domain
MKQHIPFAITALLAASPLGLAQEQPAAPAAPTGETVVYVQEPIASTPRADGPYAQLGKTLVDALNKDDSLKNSKITVQLDGDTVLLTGVTPTEQQALRAREIVAAQADGAEVVNVIQPEKIKYRTWELVSG